MAMDLSATYELTGPYGRAVINDPTDPDFVGYMTDSGISEQGTHEQLTTNGGAYAALYDLQRL